MNTKKKFYTDFATEARILTDNPTVHAALDAIDAVKEDEQADVDKLTVLVNNIELTNTDIILFYKFYSEKYKMINELSDIEVFVKERLLKQIKTFNKKRAFMNEDFSSYLKNLRKKSGLTLKEVADITGISGSYTNKIEKNVRLEPSIQVLHKYAKVYNEPLRNMLINDGIDDSILDMEGSFEDLVMYNRIKEDNRELCDEEKQLIIDLVHNLFKNNRDGVEFIFNKYQEIKQQKENESEYHS